MESADGTTPVLLFMHLKEVVINGFKSFADRTAINLGKGVTCVVGPNGCGKSNIVDAIRWVLGEQSAKALRGGKMQDVIFEGTDKRKPLSMCEVALIFTDCEKELGTAFNEVEITRRVSRDGSSDYFINGKRSRLRDIQMLFMDTGIGRSSYSFMMQGQIDQILSSNPAERRIIFEEAAGITRYKSQRKEALGKLALVEQNLSRVSDVVDEVTRQIGSLKRQASKALRFKRLKHRLTHLDLAWNSYFYSQRQAEVRSLEDKATAARKIVEELGAKLATKESGLEQSKQRRAEVYARLQEAQQSVYELRSAKEAAENLVKVAAVRVGDLRKRIADTHTEIASLNEQREGLDGRARSSAELLEEAQSAVTESGSVFQANNRNVEEVQARLSKLDVELQARKRDLLVLEGSITRNRQQCTTFELELKTYQVKHAGLTDTLYQLKEEQSVFEDRLNQVMKTREKRERERTAAEEAVTAAQQHAAGLRSGFRDHQQRIQDADRLVASRSARLSVLEDMQARFEGFSDGAKAILQGKLDEILPASSYRALSRFLKVQDEVWTGALETLLGQAAEAIMLTTAEAAAAAAGTLAERKLGRAVLQIPLPGAAPEAPPASAPDWLIAATSVVGASKAQDRAAIQSLLAGCWFCDDIEAFLNFWREHPDFQFTFVATPDGTLLDARGLLYGGSSRGKKQESSFIQRETEIRAVRADLERENAVLTELSDGAMKLQSELEAAEKEVEERRKKVVEIGQELSSLQSEERAARETLKQNEDTVRRNDRTLNELEDGRKTLEERLERAQAELATAEGRIEEHRAAITAGEEAISLARAERDTRMEELNQVRIDLAEKKTRLDSLNRGLMQIEEQKSDLQERIMRRQQEVDTFEEQVADFQRSGAEEESNAVKLGETLEQTMASLKQHKEEMDAVEAAILQVEEGLSGERNQLRHEESQLSGFEVKLAESRSQARFLLEKVEAEHELDLRAVEWKAELWKADEEFEVRVRLDDLEDESELEAKPKTHRGDPTEEDLKALDQTDWQEVAGEIKQLRDRITALGAVNLVAIEEYAELKERYEFLKTQSDDLWKSKDELLKAIEEINETSQAMFQETFAQIRKNFQFTFKKLFGGGESDLKLIDAEDVLDSGIDIIACPPGTRLRGLTLLSGGQRTMTAVSLLFAIYMVKPSPFCVLDELDAPLDDANIGRFTDMLAQFTAYSQFLVITHNKRTVAAANTIYGVTMQERGVTRMVSLRFNRDTNEAESVELEEAGAGI